MSHNFGIKKNLESMNIVKNKEWILKFKKWQKLGVILTLHVAAIVMALILIFIYGGFFTTFSEASLFHLWKTLGSYVLPILILILSFWVVRLTNLIHALICLILVFFNTALLLLSMNVNFLAMIYLIIYIGAIAILFLFVLMMFNLRELIEHTKKVPNMDLKEFMDNLLVACLFLLFIFVPLIRDLFINLVDSDKYFMDFTTLKMNSLEYFLTYQYTDTLLFGTLLYTYYTYLFLVAAMILLTSMLGSIILALSTREHKENTAIVL